MDIETFAKHHGFESYEKMISESRSIIFDHGINYYLTLTPRGWMIWIDKYPDKPLGWFETFDEGQRFLLIAFKEFDKTPKDPYFSDSDAGGES